MSRKFFTFITKLSLHLYNKLYSYIGRAAIKANGGVHPKHRITNYHAFFVSHIKTTDVVLDIGCGTGELAFDVAKKAKRVTGIDINGKSIVHAEKTYLRPNLEYITGDATTYKFSEKFDVVILSNVLEHIEKRIEFLKNIKKLAPKILIRVPAIDRDWLTLYKKELGIEWRADLTHYLEYTVPILKKELYDSGYTLQEHSVQFGEIWAVVGAALPAGRQESSK